MNCDLAHTQHPGASRDPDTSEFTTFVGRRRESLTGYGQVIIDFFIAWSRFEYALTEAGYIQNGKHSADPDVKQYYRDI